MGIAEIGGASACPCSSRWVEFGGVKITLDRSSAALVCAGGIFQRRSSAIDSIEDPSPKP